MRQRERPCFEKNIVLQDDVLYALNLGEKNILLMQHYSGRRYFIYEYNFNNNQDKVYEYIGNKIIAAS